MKPQERGEPEGAPEQADEQADEQTLENGTPFDAGDEGGREDEPSSPITRLETELAGLNDQFLRLHAEFDNYRRRTERERAEDRNRAQGQLVERLLEPLDDLQRVTEYEGEHRSVESLLEGVQMVERKLVRALEAAGLEVIQARGEPFDPNLHEALMTSEAENAGEDGEVGEVFQSGYLFRGTLLRPARVQVKKYNG